MYPQSRYRGRQGVLSSDNEVPHIFTRISRVQQKEILITSAKRLFQQHRSKREAAPFWLMSALAGRTSSFRPLVNEHAAKYHAPVWQPNSHREPYERRDH
jgi:hypothetical protein